MVILRQDDDRRLELEGLNLDETPELTLRVICEHCQGVIRQQALEPMVLLRQLRKALLLEQANSHGPRGFRHVCAPAGEGVTDGND